MSSEFSSSNEDPRDLKPVEQTLAALSPQPPQIDRDRLMFLAGAASGQGSGFGVQGSGMAVPASASSRSAWLWPAATAALAATSLALAIALVVRTNAPAQIVHVDRPAPAAPALSPQVAIQPEPSSTLQSAATDSAVARSASRPASRRVPADNYLRSREVALRMGVDALGTPRAAGGGAASPLTYFDWLAEFDDASAPAQQPNSALPKM